MSLLILSRFQCVWLKFCLIGVPFLIQRIQTLALLFKSAQSTCTKRTARASPTMLQASKLSDSRTDRVVKMAAIQVSSFYEKKVLLTQSADGGVTVPQVSHLYSGFTLKKSATMSQSAECSAAFVSGGTQVTQNTARCAQVTLPMVRSAVKAGDEVKFLMS